MARKAKLIRSFVGAGPVLASNLLARVPELGNVGRRQAARLCAVAPSDRKSGKSKRRSKVEGGRDHLRPILHGCRVGDVEVPEVGTATLAADFVGDGVTFCLEYVGDDDMTVLVGEGQCRRASDAQFLHP
jgi:transposase